MDDADALAQLLHADKIAVHAIADGSNRHIELEILVATIRSRFADVPLDAAAT